LVHADIFSHAHAFSHMCALSLHDALPISSPATLADLATSYMDIKPAEKQDILETIDLVARMDKVSRHLAERIEVLRLSQEIGQKDRKSTRLNSSHVKISYAVFCLKKKKLI